MERVQPATAPFICLEPGKFQHTLPGAIENTATAAMQAIAHGKPEQPEPPEQKQSTAQESVRKAEERVSSVDIEEMETRPERTSRNARRWGRFVAVVLCVVLVLTLSGIAAAYLSENVNTFISSTLHVDIRAQIAYLWQLIKLIAHLF